MVTDATHMADRERYYVRSINGNTDGGKTSSKPGLRWDRRRGYEATNGVFLVFFLEGSSRAACCTPPLQPSGNFPSYLRTCGTDVWTDSIPCHWGWPVACANRTKTAGSWRGRIGARIPVGRGEAPFEFGDAACSRRPKRARPRRRGGSVREKEREFERWYPRCPGRLCRYGRTGPCQLTAWACRVESSCAGRPLAATPAMRTARRWRAGIGHHYSFTRNSTHHRDHAHHTHTTAASAGGLGPRSARCYCIHAQQSYTDVTCVLGAGQQRAIRAGGRNGRLPRWSRAPALPTHVRPGPVHGQVGSNVSSLGNGAGPTLIPHRLCLVQNTLQRPCSPPDPLPARPCCSAVHARAKPVHLALQSALLLPAWLSFPPLCFCSSRYLSRQDMGSNRAASVQSGPKSDSGYGDEPAGAPPAAEEFVHPLGESAPACLQCAAGRDGREVLTWSRCSAERIRDRNGGRPADRRRE